MQDLFPAALRAKLRPSGAAVPHPGAFATATMPDTLDAAIAQFTEACEAVGGRVSRVADVAGAAEVVLAYLEAPEWRPDADAGPSAFVSWEAAHLPVPNLLPNLDARGAARLDAWVGRDQPARDEAYRRLDGAIVGITGAHAALADTGSVVLVHGEGRPRLASLLPPIHVALVAVDRLRATLGALWAEQPGMLREPATAARPTSR
jgi:L-lactate dehydrogenase complex protein LldG